MAKMPSSGRICSTPAIHAGVYEYTASFSACVLFCSPPKVGASALITSDMTKTPTIAMQKVNTAKTRPLHDGDAIGADERQRAADDRAADEAGDGADGGKGRDVAGHKRAGRSRFGRDDRPLGGRRQTDVLGAIDYGHGMLPSN